MTNNICKDFKLSQDDWLIEEKKYHPHKQAMYESLFTLGNGYLGMRGAFEENPHGSYRGMYIAGVFDKAESYVREIVKVPGWNDFSVWVNGNKFSIDTCKVISHKRALDMKKGILHRTTIMKNPDGKKLKFESKRMIFAHQVRGALMCVSITPMNFSGEIKVISGLNGDVTNQGYFPEERIKHLNVVSMQRDKESIYLEMETRDDKTKIAIAADTVYMGNNLNIIKVNRVYGEKFAQEMIFKAEKGSQYNFAKWISVFTSREGYERQINSTATDLLRDMMYEGVDYHVKKHVETREKMWQTADVQINGDRRAQKGIRFNIYHLLVIKPHHDPTVSIAAKFLTGEGYKGHVFWDTEIFMLPFYIYNFPEEARNLLMYRYYTMAGALKNSREMGYKGAKYAWESADSGEETTPNYGLRADGSSVKIFTGDEEHHIVSDVAYGVFNYMQATKDTDFLYKYGAEIIFQSARFWLSRVEKRRDRYEIRKVIGPDEFHEHVDNNAFTNYLVMWHLEYALTIYNQMQKNAPEVLKALIKKIALESEEIEKLKVVSKTIFLSYDQKSELIEQFEGYFSLDDFTVSELDSNGLPLWPKGLDLSNLERTQLLKQADVVLLLYLFPDRFSPDLKEKNYNYYEARTMHKSSLSPCIYAITGLDIGDHKRAYDYFIKTSYIDLLDANKNTGDGIHGAATGGAWMTAIHGFAGMRLRRNNLCFDPWLPKKWQEISYTCFWQGSLLQVKLNHKNISLKVIDGKAVNVTVRAKQYKVSSKKITTVKLGPKY
ncbi:MAG: glycoside hydrolase family 65 protein [Candidatus Margulisbacteria bacterium]|nr:glycoside hydrolase family 65 protein [Candidatus Margulisiibacteriota bacterium]